MATRDEVGRELTAQEHRGSFRSECSLSWLTIWLHWCGHLSKLFEFHIWNLYICKLYFNKYVCVCIYVYIKYILMCRDVYHFTAHYISITPYYIYIMEKDEKDAVFWGDHKRLSPLFSIQICINLSQYNTNVKMWYFHCSINSYMFYVCNKC